MRRRDLCVTAGLIVVAVGLNACGSAQASSGKVGENAPAQVEPIKGSGINRVTLTPQAAERIGVKTQAVSTAVIPANAGATPAMVSVPLAAVVYDKDGATWVYVVKGELTYERQAVGVVRVDGDTAALRPGPDVGTQVVIVGTQELLGAELGVAGE